MPAVKREFRIEDMDCAEEVAALQKALQGQDGVQELQFDVLNRKLIVLGDPGSFSEPAVLAAVSRTGMKAVPWARRGDAEGESVWRRHGRLISTCVAATLMAAGFVSHWAIHGAFLDALGAGATPGHATPPIAVILYAVSIVAGAWFIAPKAWAAVRGLRPDMNLLMLVAAVGAAAIGDWFEAATVTFLFAVAQLLEHWSIGRARRAITGLLDLSPATARCLSPDDGAIEERPVGDVAVGAVVLVRPGEKIPVDGEILEGRSAVDQSPITGESAPMEKGAGDDVYAGSLNGDGVLKVRSGKPASDSTLARIIHMVEEAQARRAPAEQWVAAFARRYTPIMLGFALAVMVIPPLLFGGVWTAWLYRGLVLLVIACPCALVISTPVAMVSGLTAASRHGVLIKGGTYLEAAGRLRALALDKTGTLTHGRMDVQRVVAFSGHTEREVLERAAALEAHSGHPLAQAILRRAAEEGIGVPAAAGFQSVKGKGAEASLAGRRFWIGSHRFMDEKGAETPDVHDMAEALEDAGHSVVALGNENHVCGLISAADGVRENARAALAGVRRAGIEKILMLTGDNEGTARAVAAATGVDEYRAELLPQDKVAAVEALAREYGWVAMVGDGVNDAPAMAAATFGIAMGATGTDVAIETADVALMADDLSRLPWLIRHSRRTLATIKANIVFAVGIKALFLLLAIVGYASLWMAIAADMGASLIVIFNGLRLLRTKEA